MRAAYLVVCEQSLLQGLDVVVGSLDQGFTRKIIDHVLLGRVDCRADISTLE